MQPVPTSQLAERPAQPPVRLRVTQLAVRPMARPLFSSGWLKARPTEQPRQLRREPPALPPVRAEADTRRCPRPALDPVLPEHHEPTQTGRLGEPPEPDRGPGRPAGDHHDPADQRTEPAERGDGRRICVRLVWVVGDRRQRARRSRPRRASRPAGPGSPRTPGYLPRTAASSGSWFEPARRRHHLTTRPPAG